MPPKTSESQHITEPAEGELSVVPAAGNIQAAALPINIGALIHSARSAVEPEERYLQYEAIARMAENIGTLVDAAYEQTWDAFRNDTPAWTTVFPTYEQFEQNFSSLKQRAEASAKSRNYLDEARRSLHNAGIAGEDWTQIVPPGEVSATQVRAAARCANQFSKGGINPNEAIRAINHIIIARLRKAGRGGTRIRAVTSSDYQKASNLTADEVHNCEPFSDQELEGLGLVRLTNGLVGARSEDEAIVFRIMPPADVQSLPTPAGGLIDQEESESRKRQRSISSELSELSSALFDGEDFTFDSLASAGAPSDTARSSEPRNFTRLQKRMRISEAAPGDAATTEGSVINPDEASARGEPPTAAPLEDEPLEDESRCRCSAAVSADFKRLVNRHERKSTVLSQESARIKLANQLKGYIDRGTTVCYTHLRNTAAAIGLRTRFSTDTLLHRLMIYAQSRTSIGQLKSAKETYAWFTQQVRDLHPEEIRGVFNYDTVGRDHASAFQPDTRFILKHLSMTYRKDIMEEFARTGNVHVPIFKWWFEEVIGTLDGREVTIADLARMEFDMYLWHFRKNSGNSGSLGWLRNMYYSGIQQLMRQDPEYYRCYVALRPDHHWRLISYPYYAKYAQPGDSTYFRHIDINVSQYLVDGRGGNMIQGSVSLDDERPDMCTEILPGFNTREKIAEWHSRVATRVPKSALDAFVNRVQDKKIWSREDAAHFNTDFIPMPCSAGDVRITSPLLPHGSTSMPTEGVRRTMLPWFVGIQDDHSTMETIEQGTWSEIANAHRSLVAAPRSPSGKPNVYGGIPYHFAASLPLILQSPLSNALVGRTRWNFSNTVRERNIVLGSNEEAYNSFLRDWRRQAGTAYLQHFQEVRACEIADFGHKSF
jgi:Phytanoyl-CoA dioxygenase (PhyH)